MESIKEQLKQLENSLNDLIAENANLKEENQILRNTFSRVLTLFKTDWDNVLKDSPINLFNCEETAQNKEASKVADNEYNLIDLGLPSGTLWMDRNVGASSPEDAGLYFAWGETQGYIANEVGKTKQFNWNVYKFGDTLTKYNSTDGLTTLETVDDAAYQYTNSKCKMPTKAQLQELLDETTSTWTTQNGVNGRLFTSKTNGNSIFVPAVGDGYGGSMYGVGSSGFLWSSSLYGDGTDYAWHLYFNSDDVDLYDYGRCRGQSVRGVVAASK